jgi:hypothetical protein
MIMFSILKKDHEYSLKQYALYRLRLDPLSVPLKKSGAPTCPLDGVSLLIVRHEIF